MRPAAAIVATAVERSSSTVKRTATGSPGCASQVPERPDDHTCASGVEATW